MCEATFTNSVVDGKNCISECPTGEYVSSDDSCQPCGTNCERCGADECYGCAATFVPSFVNLRDCVSECGSGKYQSTDDDSCIDCSANCTACTVDGCETCADSFDLISGACYAG